MAYIQVEASVRTHRKFLKAGPAASWLWLCGVGYCQDGLTDGFIPFEAIDFLGIKGSTARKLKVTLVSVGLWEEVSGGWQIHDYLKHNKSAAAVGSIKQSKREAGKAGGVASGEARREAAASAPYEAPREPISSRLSDDSASATATPRVDLWVAEFLKAYPGQGKCASHLLETAFFGIVGTDRGEFDALMGRLEQHKRSAQWQSGKIPRADRYLREGLHLQTLPEVLPADTGTTSRRPAWAVKS